jgi:hypothetical protein
MAETRNRPAVPIDDRLREIAEASEPKGRGYRRGGRQDWDPAGAGTVATQAEVAARRRAEFAALRDQGLTIAETAKRLGITMSTAYDYSSALRRSRRGGGPS